MYGNLVVTIEKKRQYKELSHANLLILKDNYL